MSETILPTHVGLILDGNRRWAETAGLPKLEGHQHGYETLKTIAEAAFDRGIKFITAYVFSTENWSRSKNEVSYLMDLALLIFKKDMNELLDKGFKVLWLGIPDGLSKRHLKAIKDAEDRSKNNTKGTIGLCFNYGGQREIIDAARKVIEVGKELTEASIEKFLYAPELPPLDFIIRTSGEQRLSNFMLWRAAYAELYFTDKMWPEFSVADLDEALVEYKNRQRRFGA